MWPEFHHQPWLEGGGQNHCHHHSQSTTQTHLEHGILAVINYLFYHPCDYHVTIMCTISFHYKSFQ